MSRIIDMKEGRLNLAVKRGYRNWISRFKEDFGAGTRLCDISSGALSYLAQGKDKGTFYIYDLIMNIQGLGSGFEFNELGPKEQMRVIDRYLLLLDRIRFECMKRLGWLESYSGEEYTLVELIVSFDSLAPGLQASVPLLKKDHPGFPEYSSLNTMDREVFVRRLIPKALKEVQDSSFTR